MATAQKKGKNDKKSAKKYEDTMSVGDKTDDVPNQEELQMTPAPENGTPITESPPQAPSPDPVYEEPVLTQLIVQSYEGDKTKGLYDGEGEAHFAGGHHYKGHFSEGMMQGQGCYTWANGVIYEGTFTENHVTGKGTYNWPDGSSYEGTLLDGRRHGFGTFICANQKMLYTGEWQMGKRNGKGRMNYDPEGVSFYDGDLVNNVRQGWGMRQYPSGNVYQGAWYQNVRHGEGTMRWLDREQMYNGQWEKGVQHGIGQHIWFLHRRAGSQYALRNMYDGEFVKGLRHGYGTFYYANGARYEGEWRDNMKSGRGKFVFKNGRIYEGVFEKDHIMEFPSFTMDGVSTPDLTQIRTRTPLPTDGQTVVGSEQVSVQSNASRNTYGPSFQLEVDRLLQEFTETDRDEEATQVIFVIMRHMTKLRKIYTYYSQLGYEDSADNTFVMSRLQFWRFLKDCRLHHHDMTLTDMDRVLSEEKGDPVDEMHNPHSKILMREFINYLVILAYHIYHEEHEGTTPILQWCLSRLMSDNVLPRACSVQGNIFHETRRAINALVHLDQAFEVYKSMCTPRKGPPSEPAMKMRQFLFLCKDFNLINSDLTPKAVIDILAGNDPNVTDPEGAVNLELEMTFLEFFEALVGCAQVFVTEAVVKDPTTPRPSTTLTAEQSLISMTGSPSRMASQVGIEDAGDGATPNPAMSEGGSPAPRAASEMTHRTTEGAPKNPEQYASNTTAASLSDEGRQLSHHTRAESGPKSDLLVVEPKKSASFRSTLTDGEQAMAHSGLSLGGGANSEVDGHDGSEDSHPGEDDDGELDEATRQFNFWTHQVHIFFVRKFFPAAQRHVLIRQRITEKYTRPSRGGAVVCDAVDGDGSLLPEVVVDMETASRNDVAPSDILEEQEDSVIAES